MDSRGGSLSLSLFFSYSYSKFQLHFKSYYCIRVYLHIHTSIVCVLFFSFYFWILKPLKINLIKCHFNSHSHSISQLTLFIPVVSTFWVEEFSRVSSKELFLLHFWLSSQLINLILNSPTYSILYNTLSLYRTHTFESLQTPHHIRPIILLYMEIIRTKLGLYE